MTLRRWPLLAFGVALALSILALVLTRATSLATVSPFLLFLIAVLLSTHLGGWGPGLLATVFATVTSIYFLLPPLGSFNIASPDDALSLAIFVLLAILLIVFVSRDADARASSVQDLTRLAAIVDLSQDAIITMNLDGVITTWNPGAQRLFGYAAHEVVGKSIAILYPPDRYNELQDVIARIERGEPTEPFETVRVAKDGRRIDVSISEMLLRDAQGIVIGVSKVVHDISARKYAQDTERFFAEVNDVLASSLDYETTLASIARLAVPHMADWCAVYVTLDDGTIQQLALTHVDPAKVDLAHELQRRFLDDPQAPYGVPNVIHTGKPELAPPPYFTPITVPNENETIASGDPGLKSVMVVPLITPGRTFGAISFVSADSGRYYTQADLILAQDLARRASLAVENARLYHKAQTLNEELDQRVAQRTTELETANRQLRLLAGHLQSAREEERIKVARDIHDDIGTLMAAIKMDLTFLAREISGKGEKRSPEMMQEEIRAMLKLVDDAIQMLHQIVRELRPDVLDHLGLGAALEWQVQEFQERTKIACQFVSSLNEFDLDPERSTAIFRIMQETLTNVARHAQATQVEASLHREDGHLILEVRDNGVGISDVPDGNRFGILGMRERAHVFGGDVTIHGSPGKGTVVTVRIPV